MKQQVCALCGKGEWRLKLHVETEHHMDFDLYLREYHFGKRVGYCLYCGSKVRINQRDYAKYCNNTCQLKYQYSKETKEEKEQRIKKFRDVWGLDLRQKQSETHKALSAQRDKSFYEQRSEKQRQTCLKLYGVINPTLTPEVKAKMEATNLKRYGVTNIFFIKNKDPEFRKKVVEGIRRNSTLPNKWVKRENVDINLEKRYQTNLKKYGVKHYFQSKEHRDNLDVITDKIHESKLKNNSLNTSKQELEIYDFLCSLGYDVKREYKDHERYPYFCDLYIKDFDLFIELQLFYTHGPHPYTGSEEDLNLVNKLKLKNTDSAWSTIDVWTRRDVSKRNIALQNKLNFLEIYTSDLEEIKSQILLKINSLKDVK